MPRTSDRFWPRRRMRASCNSRRISLSKARKRSSVKLVRSKHKSPPDVWRALIVYGPCVRSFASRLPEISLTGGGGYTTNAILQDLRYKPWLWTAAGNVLAPIYTGGYLPAQVKIADQNQKAALALYGQTVLKAFDDVEVTRRRRTSFSVAMPSP